MHIQNFVAGTYKKVLRPMLFRFDPEAIHDAFLSLGQLLGKFQITRLLTSKIFQFQHPQLEQTIHGIFFPNPIGLSAGFDKDAHITPLLSSIGFGFGQVGTVTTKPYPGNPKPRLYRLPKSKAIVVYYGLKNLGADIIFKKIQQNQPYDIPLSISIGKTNSKTTATTKAGINDYYRCLQKAIDTEVGDFYTINISCPNTFGGEPFTTPATLDPLLKKLMSLKPPKPMFVKMPINLPWKEFDALLKIIVKHKLAGVIIGNLNKDRQHTTIKDSIPEHVKGGISGMPTQKLSDELIFKTYQQYKNNLTIIGVGGIFTAQDAYHKIRNGASLVQLITGMIYEGPQLIGQINQELVQLSKKDGFTNISQAIGANHNK